MSDSSCEVPLSHLLFQPEHFPFLDVSHSNLDLRSRTTFYTALGRLLLVELGEDEERFERFISPMTGRATEGGGGGRERGGEGEGWGGEGENGGWRGEGGGVEGRREEGEKGRGGEEEGGRVDGGSGPTPVGGAR